MGLTIHYKFKFQGTNMKALEKINTVRKCAEDLHFEKVGPIWLLDFSKDYNDDKENFEKAGKEAEGNYRWAKIQYQPRGEWRDNHHYPNTDAPKYKGFIFMAWAGYGCEPTNIGLISKDGKEWIGNSFTKTQYAENFVKCHLLVVTILDVCKKVGILESVSDEGDYWETRDLSKLGDNINASTKMIMEIGNVLKKSFGKDHISSSVDKSKNFMKVNKNDKRRTCKADRRF